MQVQDMINKEYVIYSSVNKMSRDMSIKVILCSDVYSSLRTEINRLIDNLIHEKLTQNVVIKVSDLSTAQMLEEYFGGHYFVNKMGYLMVHVRFHPKGSTIYLNNPQDFTIAVSEDSHGYVTISDSRATLGYWATYFVNNDFEDTLFNNINTIYPFKPIYEKYLI